MRMLEWVDRPDENANGYIRIDPAQYCTSQTFGMHAVLITLSGKSVGHSDFVSHLLIDFRLPVDQFKPRRDQRQALHRWNRFVVGDEYVKGLARVHPKSKEDKARRNDFDLATAVHESEHVNLKR